MNYLRQFLIIICFTFLGELLNLLIPLPIPAAVYGLVLLFLALQLGIVKLEQVRTVGEWLVSIMGILFVAKSHIRAIGCYHAINQRINTNLVGSFIGKRITSRGIHLKKMKSLLW